MQTREHKRGAAALILAAGCLMYMLSGGIRSNFGILLQSLADHAGVSYAQASLAVAIGQLMYGVSQPLFGILALRRSSGFVLIIGAVLMACGLGLASLCTGQMMLILSVGLLFFTGTGAVCYGMIMSAITPLVGEARAAAASGILNASSGIGASLLSPAMQALQSGIGIGALLRGLGAVSLSLIPLCLWLNAKSAPDASVKRENPLAGLSAALRDRDYIRLMIGFGTCGFHMCIIQTHIYAQIVSYGIAESTASIAYTVFGLSTMLGSVLCGALCQKAPMHKVLGGLYATRAAVVAVFMLLLPKNVASVFAFIIIMGMTGDATVTPTSGIIARRFGAQSIGLLFGVTFVCHQIGGFASSWLGGLFIGEGGNYMAIWLIDIALCALAAVVSWRITQPERQFSST